jgi:hypothetical protein
LNKEKAQISMEAHNLDSWKTKVDGLNTWAMEESLLCSVISATKASYSTGVQF